MHSYYCDILIQFACLLRSVCIPTFEQKQAKMALITLSLSGRHLSINMVICCVLAILLVSFLNEASAACSVEMQGNRTIRKCDTDQICRGQRICFLDKPCIDLEVTCFGVAPKIVSTHQIGKPCGTYIIENGKIENGKIIHPADGSSYENNESCEWFIYSSVPLFFYTSKFSTELGYDYFFAHDGNSIGSPIIAQLSGESQWSTFTTVGDAYLRFVSDESEVGSGFILHWKIKTDGPKPTEDSDCNCDCPKPTEGSDCNCDYSTFSSSHTMNKYTGPDQSCGAYTKTGVTDDEIKTILKTHNELREKVAKGLETKGSPGPQPSAKNMLELKWNCELAEVAQKWAERCELGHDRGDDRKICNRDYRVGQNARSGWSSRAASASEWESAIKSWYSEVKDMPKSVVESWDSSLLYDIGHYTQVVWAETYEIGCGGIDFPGSRGGTAKIYVCNYGGAGNWRNRKIYEDGKAASNCPNGASSDYPGLCAPPS